MDELEIVKQLRDYGYSVKYSIPLVHQTIMKLTLSYRKPTLQEVIDEILAFHPILGVDQLALMENCLAAKNSKLIVGDQKPTNRQGEIQCSS